VPDSAHPELASVFRSLKGGRPLAALTAYDYPTARLLDEAGLDMLLVGDSLGMVVLGFEDTTSVTMEDMVRHTGAVRRGTKRAFLVTDLPIATYETPEMAVENARRLVTAGADAVKLEGGKAILSQIQAILAENIPVVGHLGMLPQHVKVEGGYKKKGKTAAEAEAILADALALDAAGVCAMVLESMVPSLAAEVTSRVTCPTIGIGAGDATDGQIRVVHDLLGTFPWFRPKFAECYHDGRGAIQDAAAKYLASLSANPKSIPTRP
jgi:3-methyl-2-oxobutanoate hydroxymethyltransferase